MKKTLWMLMAFLMTVSVSVFAQPLEEEEEPVQARPNPMERTMKGTSVRNASEMGMQKGKAYGVSQQKMNSAKVKATSMQQKQKAVGQKMMK